MQEGETLGSMAGVVGMDSRGSFENGFAWSTGGERYLVFMPSGVHFGKKQ